MSNADPFDDAPPPKENLSKSVYKSVMIQPVERRSNSNNNERSVMRDANDLSRLSNAEAEEYLRSMMNVCQVAVKLQFDPNEQFDISLTQNLVIKSIRTQRAFSELIVGDQLLLVNGRASLNVDHAFKLLLRGMPTLNLVVGRVAYKKPIPDERASRVQLKRQAGYSYFIATIQRVGNVHLGLGIKSYRGKTTINRTDENTLAAYIYLIGDSIIDIDGEKVTDATQLRNKMLESMKTNGQFTTIVERVDPTQATHHIQYNVEKSVFNPEVDPVIASDVTMICQRELVKHELCNRKKRKLKSILKNNELTVTRTQCDDTFAEEEVNKKSDSDSNRAKVRKSGSKSKSKYEKLSKISRNKKSKKITFNTNKNEEEKIATDVPNTLFLQHVKNLNKQGLKSAFTFMPKFLQRG